MQCQVGLIVSAYWSSLRSISWLYLYPVVRGGVRLLGAAVCRVAPARRRVRHILHKPNERVPDIVARQSDQPRFGGAASNLHRGQVSVLRCDVVFVCRPVTRLDRGVVYLCC